MEDGGEEFEAPRHIQDIADPQLRFGNLTRLINKLSPWEARHVKIQLNGCKGLAGREDHPLELVGIITQHLALEDVYSCFRVSKA